ncbi:MAG: nSTAND1 domain-containing NTPase, partial [Beijerinckiaceae bacterium]
MSYRAFISSTFEDLKEHRLHVIRSLRRAGITVDPMEEWTADSNEPKVFSQDRVKNCQLCVLLVGFRRGFVPEGSDSSITQLEYEAAMRLGIDVLVFMLDEKAPWYREFDERDSDPEVKRWRSQLAQRHGVEKFGLDPSSIDIGGALGRWLTTKAPQKSGQALPARIDWPKDKSPYPGLLRFDQEYAPVFFGRECDVDEIIAKMLESTGRIVIVSGASGTGKSSLIDAGVWRALIRDNRIAGSQDWIWLRIQPGDSETPFASLAWGLKQAFPKIAMRPPDLAKVLEEKQDELQQLLIKHLAGDQELILFIDQLEELFTRGFGASRIQAFLDTIVAVTAIKRSRLRVLATVRNEFLGHLAEIPVMRQLLNA